MVDIKEHETKLRQLLLSNTAPKENEYKVGMIGIQNNSNQLIKVVVDPAVLKIGNGEVAFFLINGYFYFIELKPPTIKIFEKTFLKNAGQIDMPLLHGEVAIKLLKAFGISESIATMYVNDYTQD